MAALEGAIMYEHMKIVYENGESFCMEICAPDKEEFYKQLLTTFEDAICKHNPDDWGLVDIKYVEVQ